MRALVSFRLTLTISFLFFCLQNQSGGHSDDDSEDSFANPCLMAVRERLVHGNRFCTQLMNTIRRTRYHHELINDFLLDVPLSSLPTIKNLGKSEVATMHFNHSFADLIYLHGQALISYRNHLRHQLMPKLLPPYRPEVPFFRHLFTMTDRHVVLLERLICLLPDTSPETFCNSLANDRLQNLSSQLSLSTGLSTGLDETYASPSDSRATLARYVFLHHFNFTLARLGCFYQDLLLAHP